ncbi:MAG: UDP-2,4-diacetamido-2,4,6-trideoxy-beta-L-altropyranose hydrolase [Lactobacillales bacterium]|jgi:UDP-2,4-diacetamido-2,4,6-trideoxy-beta-L-altropyranose hydrolase|nr:UDP-2,4-diacetamido-2,4,6-trideoxy-beta-L-altropyranose hydrolase [Lactobacillales bacterium]
MIGFRVDANSKIATGHLMRCLSIAIELESQGLDCVFISADNESKIIIDRYGFHFISLGTYWQNMDSEIDAIKKVIIDNQIKKLVIDSYYVTERYLEKISNLTKTIYIDDVNRFIYPVDMLINYSPYYDLFDYEKRYKNINTKLILGCDYVPLRQEFKNVPLKIYENNVEKILVTCGGTDNFNFMGKLLTKIVKNNLFRGIEFHLVFGAFNRNRNILYRLSETYRNVMLHENVDYISELMKSSDLAITAGGSTVYEFCACGVPSISFSFAGNQLYGVRRFAEMGIIDYAGDIRDGEELLFSKIISKVQEYIDDPQKRKLRSKKMQKLVDGRGTERLCEKIINF